MDFKNIPNINHLWGTLIVEELLRCGAEYFCIAPGSRSAPLSVAVAQNPRAKAFVHFDERGLAFHALGYAAGSKKPAVLICTSGTAVANFLPAVIEASKKKLPLIVLTADRPPELRHTGAVQTIDQVKIFGSYVKWFMDLPCPDAAIDPAYVLTSIDQAVYQAQGATPGVVHINCMFREPLAPVKDRSDVRKLTAHLNAWGKSGQVYSAYHAAVSTEIHGAENIIKDMQAIKNGLIVVGKMGSDADRQAALKLATKLGWPVVADVSSGLRLGSSNKHVIHYFDHLLLSPKIQRWLSRVDGIIHLGGRMTSKRFYEWVEQKTRPYIMVLNHALRNDPNNQVTHRVHASAAVFTESIMHFLKKRKPSVLLGPLSQVNEAVDITMDRFFNEDGRLSEPLAARLVARGIPAGQGLFLANSMPVRDMDFYGAIDGHAVHVNGNRGASGIDGLIASACGYGQGLQMPVTLMIGDLAALHDLNSLAMLKDAQQPLIMVVLNNGGGGIFSFLPIAEHKDVFEKFFGTPHPFTFANAAAMFELNYAQPRDTKSFTLAYRQALNSKTSTIIEVMTGREDNLKIHKALQKKIAEAV